MGFWALARSRVTNSEQPQKYPQFAARRRPSFVPEELLLCRALHKEDGVFGIRNNLPGPAFFHILQMQGYPALI